MSATPWIDVVLVNYRAAGEVLAAVKALQGEAGHWPHGAIQVVDNSEDPREVQTLETALTACRDVQLLVMPRNVGFGAACQAAWDAGRGRYTLLLNPDARIAPQAVVQLGQALDARLDVGAASPRTWWDAPGGWVLPCPTPQHPVARLTRAAASRRGAEDWADLQVQRTKSLMAGAAPIEVDLLAGAVLMVRREAARRAGGLFDSQFFMYFEDAELSDRLRAAGWKLVVFPDVDAVHSWRHLPHKAPLMAAGEAVYLRRQAPWFRALRTLWPGAEALQPLRAWAGTVANAQEAARVLGAVEALSPSPAGDPAWVRWDRARALNETEWDLLEPGRYWARTLQGWRAFEKRGPRGSQDCPCCGARLQPGLAVWHWRCPACGYEQGRLQSQIDDGMGTSTAALKGVALDEGLRREALSTLRQLNFRRVLSQMQAHRRAGQTRLLDVGAAHGWFVQAAGQADHPWQALGLEPDAAVARQAQDEGLPVRHGYFPQALQEDECFDAITFHDVFEHLPDLDAVMAALRRHLLPGGLLVLNLPSSEGVFFRMAQRLARWGLRGPWLRMWQLDMPSPHVHYFNADNLSMFLERQGLMVVARSALPSIVREGLMARLRFDPRSAWMAPVLGPLLWLLVPLLQRLSPDIRVVIARSQAEASERP